MPISQRLLCYLLPLFLLGYGQNALADDTHVLFDGDIHHSGYCDMDIKFTQVNGHDTSLPGFNCVWLMNDRFYFGGSVYGTMNPIPIINSNYSQAGFIAGYYYRPSHLLHLSMQLFVGKAVLPSISGFVYTLYEPSVSLNINLTRFAKAHIGMGYRMVNGNSSGYGPAQINGMVYSIGLLINPFEITYPKIKTEQ